MDARSDGLVVVGTVEELRTAGLRHVQAGGASLVVLWHEGTVFALDNRCPHLGFPLHRGDVHDGLLACHWHHARFDVTCGATLDPWADDVPCHRVVVEDGVVLVDPRAPRADAREHGLARLARGLADDLWLVVAKAVVELAEAGVGARDALVLAARHGALERDAGWQPGLSILSAAARIEPLLDPVDRQRARFHAFLHVAADASGQAPRRPLPGLGGSGRDAAGLRAWLRETVEVRDGPGTDRVLRTLVERHGAAAALDAVLAACTDHRYADVGHTLDYALKCAELVESCGGDDAPRELVATLFTSLGPQLVQMRRMEETTAWRSPVDVAALVADAAGEVPAEPFAAPPQVVPVARDRDALVDLLLGDTPAATVAELVRRVRAGEPPAALADAVVHAAVLRVLRFGTANETSDWDTVHHTLTYANAVAEGLRRVPSPELFRGVLDGAMSVYLDRFLNVPAAPLPRAAEAEGDPEPLRAELLAHYDTRAAVDAAARTAWTFLARGGAPARLLATLGHAVHREDAGFHAYQQLEVAARRVERATESGDTPATHFALTACARWLAAQFPTRRAREQSFRTARRLHRGEALFRPDGSAAE